MRSQLPESVLSVMQDTELLLLRDQIQSISEVLVAHALEHID